MLYSRLIVIVTCAVVNQNDQQLPTFDMHRILINPFLHLLKIQDFAPLFFPTHIPPIASSRTLSDRWNMTELGFKPE